MGKHYEDKKCEGCDHYKDCYEGDKMNAKIQKEFTLTVGTNEEGVTEEQLVEKVAELELYGNENFGVRFHIFEKE